MSLAPAIDPAICGIHGEEPARNDWCPLPGCASRAQERHHLWSRSYLRGQPQNWVQLPSMSICANVMRLCVMHHRKITGEIGGHQGWIKLEHGDVFVYCEPEGNGWKTLGQLNPQPEIKGMDGSPKREAMTAARAHVHLKPGESCETCGYTRPVKGTPGPKRKQATWTVNVPDDAEIGADVLDDWVEQFAAVLGFEGSKGITRYHVLAVVLAWAMQNKVGLIEDLTEARMR